MCEFAVVDVPPAKSRTKELQVLRAWARSLDERDGV